MRRNNMRNPYLLRKTCPRCRPQTATISREDIVERYRGEEYGEGKGKYCKGKRLYLCSHGVKEGVCMLSACHRGAYFYSPTPKLRDRPPSYPMDGT